MRLIGLTGGIASGKSTVSALLREKGAALIDADQVAREVVEPGTPALAEIAARFPGVVVNGALDRAKLAQRVFGDEAERAALNALTHPCIREAVLLKTLAFERAGAPRVIYDAPLLIENRLHEGMHDVILVWAPRAVQKRRLMERNGLSAEQAEARLAAQQPLDDKRAFATWVIDNGGTLDQTRRQVDALWQQILALPPA